MSFGIHRVRNFLINALTVIAGVIGAGAMLCGCMFRKPVTGPTTAPVWTANVGASTRPTIVEGVVYLLGGSEDGPDHLFAFDGATGKQLWATEFEAVELLAVRNNQAFIRDRENFLHTLDARTGVERVKSKIENEWIASLWADDAFYGVNANAELVAQGNPGWRVKTPYTRVYDDPVLDRGLIYLYGRHHVNDDAGIDGKPFINNAPMTLTIITAYDAKTGELRWKRENKPGCLISAPLVANGIVYFTEEGESRKISRADQPAEYKVDYTLHAFDIAANKDLWAKPTDDELTEVGGPQFIDGDVLYSLEAPGNPAWHYRALSIKTGETLWQMQPEIKSLKPANYIGGILYVTGRRAHALLNERGDTSPDSWLAAIDSRTGRQLWHSEPKDLSEFTAPVAAGGMVYIASAPFYWNGVKKGGEYKLYAFRASRDGA